MAKITVAFTIDTETNKRILRWLEGLPSGGKSKAIRDALDDYLGKGGVTLGDVYEAVMELKRAGVMVARADNPQAEVNVPADVLEKLGGLGL